MPCCAVRKLCRLLQTNRQWYDQHRCPSAHQEDDQQLRAAIQEVREAEAFYGYRRVTKALVRAGRIGQPPTSLACDATSEPALPKDPTNRAYHRLAAESTWVYPNLVKGLQVEAPHPGSGC